MANYGVPNLVQITVGQSVGETTPSNTFFVLNETGGSLALAADDIVVPLVDFYTSVAAFLSEDWLLEEIILTEADTDLPAQVAVPVALSGDQPGNLLPRQTALVVSWRTGVASKRARGRTYLTGFQEGVNDDGAPSAGSVAAIFAAGTALIGDLIAADCPLVILSRGGVPPTTWDPFATPVLTCLCDAVWDTQRRRQLQP